jgi:hypothetical protein
MFVPDNLGAEAMAGYETAFFRSHFTHTNRQKPGCAWQGWADRTLGQPAGNPDAAAMQRALAPAKETLSTVIKRITHSRNDN